MQDTILESTLENYSILINYLYLPMIVDYSLLIILPKDESLTTICKEIWPI